MADKSAQTVLITRPEDSGRGFVALLEPKLKGASILLAPVLRIEMLQPRPLTGPFSHTLITSRHAVAYAAEHFPSLPALCVGQSTAEHARAQGVSATAAGGDAEALIELARRENAGPMIHLRGEHTRGDICAKLVHAGCDCQELVVYRQAHQLWSPDIKAQILSAPNLLVPLFSPRSAALCAENLADFKGNLQVVAMSSNVLDNWHHPATTRTCIAEKPDLQAMVAALASQIA